MHMKESVGDSSKDSFGVVKVIDSEFATTGSSR